MPGFRVSVPATSANLGPGFDAFGLALGLYEVIEVHSREHGLHVETVDAGAGEVGEVPTGEDHLVLRGLRAACARLGARPPGLHLRCHNAIPHARGLGSSAAAVVAGIAAGYALAGTELDSTARDDALELAAAFEGHADNAAAALAGGFTVVWQQTGGERGGERGGAGGWRHLRLEPHPDIRPVVAVPEQRSSTSETRELLPDVVARGDACFSAGRAALGLHALTSDPSLLLAGTEDRLHEQYRAAAYPATARLVGELRARGIAATVSGGGPTVLALTTDGCLPAAVDTAGFSVRELPVDRAGVGVVAV